ncbi:MAG: SCO family protein [Deltaproteobacteria bacterium]|nr:MAG: SCO family protein [Deltaproteobacteria bacterium]
MGSLPDLDATFTDQLGREVRLADLSGKTWLCAFIFTRCASSCPIMTARMAQIAEMSKGIPDFRLVSFSVDPIHDTPEVLARYARQYGADPERWRFLTGEKGAIYALARKGFKLGVEKDDTTENIATAFLHSNRFVLVDQRGRIRRYYDSTEADVPERVIADIGRLAGEGR